MSRILWLPVLLATVLLTGCGGGEFDTTAVSGTVTFDGQPVTSGRIRFVPQGDSTITGKPAQGEVQPDGTFVLTTYDEGDGAVVGRHRVYYAPPESLETSETEELDANGEPKPKKSTSSKIPFANAGFAEEMFVEVTADGENMFNFELTTVKNR